MGETICLWNAKSWDLESVILLVESGILLMIGIYSNLTTTADMRNPVPGIQNPRHFWITFNGASCWITQSFMSHK